MNNAKFITGKCRLQSVFKGLFDLRYFITIHLNHFKHKEMCRQETVRGTTREVGDAVLSQVNNPVCFTFIYVKESIKR